MKKRMLFILTLAVAVCACCLFASAQDTAPVIQDHIVYELIPATDQAPAHYEIVSLFDSEEAMQGVTEITIPAELDGVPVTAISCNRNYVYTYKNAEVETINLPDTIETIGKLAFAYCNNLKEITLPESVRRIGPQSFANCKQLAQVHLNDGLQIIGKATFDKFTALQYITLPVSLQAVERRGFTLSGLKSVRIPGSCSVNDSAFSQAKELKKVVFENRTNDDTSFIGHSAFSKCVSLLKVYLPKEAPAYNIGFASFYGCQKLKAVYRTDSLQSINDSFRDCEALKSFTLPAEIQSIQYMAFSGCTNLKKLRVLATSPAFLTAERLSAEFLKHMPKGCKIYVKTAEMKDAFLAAGCTNRVVVKADLA